MGAIVPGRCWARRRGCDRDATWLGARAGVRYVGFNRPRSLALMDFRILGPLEALDEGRDVALAGSKRRALLALLLVHANETVSIERLIDELW